MKCTVCQTKLSSSNLDNHIIANISSPICLQCETIYTDTGIYAKIKNVGYSVIEVDVSEFRKVDGGLSCLSLRF